MFRISGAAGAALILVLGSLSVSAQDVAEIDVIEIDNRGGVPDYFPAADGIHVAYQPRSQDEVLFVDNLSDGSRIEIPLPQEGGFPVSIPPYNPSLYIPLDWSPDGTKFAFSGSDFIRLREGDLWIYDLTTEVWTNVTDDGYDGGAMRDAFLEDKIEPDQPLLIETQPSWSPDGSMIAFEQFIYTDSDTDTARIMLLDVESGEIRKLVEVPKSVPGDRNMGTTASLEWSPDGSTLYLGVLGYTANSTANGLYQVDVATGELQKLLTPDLLDGVFEGFAGRRGDEDERMLFTPIRVSPNGRQLLLWLGAVDFASGQYWPFVYDLEAKTFTSVVPVVAEGEGTFQPIIPRHAVWSPDGTQVLTLSRMLTTDDDIPALMPIEDEAFLLGRYTIASDEFEALGRVAAPGAVPIMGEWSQSGNAILGPFQFAFE